MLKSDVDNRLDSFTINKAYVIRSIIVIAPAFSFPACTGGDIRLFELLRRLSSVFELHLLAYGIEACVTDFIEYSGVKSVRVLAGEQSLGKLAITCPYLDLWRYAPHGVRYDRDPQFDIVFQNLIKEVSPDAVLVEHLYMYQYVCKIIGKVPVFLSAYDVESVKHFRWYQDASLSWKGKLRVWLQRCLIKRMEAFACRTAFRVFATSDADAYALKAKYGKVSLCTVPNGADVEYFSARDRQSFDGIPGVVFVGSMFYKPNSDAVARIINTLWPKIHGAVPNAACHIVGGYPDMDINISDCRDSGILFHGKVADIRLMLSMAQVSVVPLMVGSGTRIKILESLASGTPVVSTTMGAEGIMYQGASGIIIADDDDTFCQRVVELLEDRERAFQMGRAGRSLVEEYYTWDRSAQVMIDAMSTLFRC